MKLFEQPCRCHNFPLAGSNTYHLYGYQDSLLWEYPIRVCVIRGVKLPIVNRVELSVARTVQLIIGRMHD